MPDLLQSVALFIFYPLFCTSWNFWKNYHGGLRLGGNIIIHVLKKLSDIT